MLTACSTGKPPAGRAALTPLQRTAMQTRDIQGDFDTAFSAVLTILQDEGWQIQEVDKNAGVIQAASLKRQALIGPEDDGIRPDDPQIKELQKRYALAAKHRMDFALWTRWEQLTARLEPWGQGAVRVRITIVKCGALPSGTR